MYHSARAVLRKLKRNGPASAGNCCVGKGIEMTSVICTFSLGSIALDSLMQIFPYL